MSALWRWVAHWRAMQSWRLTRTGDNPWLWVPDPNWACSRRRRGGVYW